MSRQLNDISNALALFASQYGPPAIIPATVISVDEKKAVISARLIEGSEVIDIRLRSLINDGGSILLVPKEGSLVLLGSINNSNNYVVISIHEVTRIIYKTGKATFDMNDSGHLIQREQETLRKLLEDLLDEILRMRFTTQSGPTVSLVNQPAFEQIKNRIKNLLRNAE